MGLTEMSHRKDEKIDGVIYDMSPTPGFRHGIINSNIHAILKHGLKNSLCLVFMENLDFKYHPDINDDYLCPDIMIICDRKYLKGSFYSGVPKMILETLSPSTAKRDRTEESNTFYNRKLFLLAAGCIIYKLIWEFHLHVLNISPSAYKGADSVSVGSIVMCLPHNIIKTYGAFIDYFFGRSIKHNIFQNMGLYYLVYGIVIITLAMEILELLNKSKIKVLLITAACAVLPMAYNGVLRDIGINLTYAEDDVSAAMNGRDDVKNMPLFPAESSIQEIDGYIVIKVLNV